MKSLAVILSSLSLGTNCECIIPWGATDARCCFGFVSMPPISNFEKLKRRRENNIINKGRLAGLYSSSSSSPSSPASPVIDPDESLSRSKNSSSSAGSSVSRRDVLSVASHLLFCVTSAMTLSTYEDYDCANLKPLSGTLRYPPYLAPGDDQAQETTATVRPTKGMATRGMGKGSTDRSLSTYEYYYGIPSSSQQDIDLRSVPSYNEIMLQHRTQTVPQWKNLYSAKKPITETKVRTAVRNIYNALLMVFALQQMSQDYQWEEMRSIVKQPVLTTTLEDACNVLRSAQDYIDVDGRTEIGFHWGSCAWRHCGAQADAQEALAELDKSVGLLEPYECLFVLDIVERSLRDILAVVPIRYHLLDDVKKVKSYEPYKSQGETNDGWDPASENDGKDNSSLDTNFLNALNRLRNDLS